MIRLSNLPQLQTCLLQRNVSARQGRNVMPGSLCEPLCLGVLVAELLNSDKDVQVCDASEVE